MFYTDYPIEELELGVRAYNILKRMGIDFFGDLIHVTPFDLNCFYERSLDERAYGIAICGETLRQIVEAQAMIRELRSGKSVAEVWTEHSR